MDTVIVRDQVVLINRVCYKKNKQDKTKIHGEVGGHGRKPKFEWYQEIFTQMEYWRQSRVRTDIPAGFPSTFRAKVSVCDHENVGL